MGPVTRRLQWELDRFELYTGQQPTEIVVARDVWDGYKAELLAAARRTMVDDGFHLLTFNGYPLRPRDEMPVGAVIVESVPLSYVMKPGPMLRYNWVPMEPFVPLQERIDALPGCRVPKDHAPDCDCGRL